MSEMLAETITVTSSLNRNRDAAIRARINSLAAKISELGLTTPALFLLELHRPLRTVCYNAAIFLEPLAAPLFGFERLAEYREILSSAEYTDLLAEQLAKDEG